MQNACWADLRIFAWRFCSLEGLKRATAIAIGESVVGISSLEFRSLELGSLDVCWVLKHAIATYCYWLVGFVVVQQF